MAKIPVYGAQKEQTQVVRGPRASGVPEGAFGGAVAQGLGNLGKGIADMQQRIATTEAEEALVKFERDKNKLFFDPDAGYFNTQGRNAYDTASTANESLQKLVQQYSEGLQSDTARQLFSKAAAVHLQRGEQDIMRHSAKGLQAWEAATIEARVENSLENAALYWTEGVNKQPGSGSNQIWERLKKQESGSRQLDADGKPITSSAGAVGIAQIMPTTGPEAAKLAGVDWDPERFKYDADYNEQLGKAYFDQQMRDFDIPLLAAAAYNAGPGNVRKWLREIGDPRTGEISASEFAQRIPFEETRNYVQKVVGAENFMRVAGSSDQPDRLTVQRAVGRQAVIDAAEIQGIGAEALNERLQTYESSFASAVIEAATSSSSREGQAALQKYGDRLEGPQRVKIENAIQAKQKTERTQYLSTQAVALSSGIIRDNESRADVIAAVNQIEDPELRDRTMRQAMYQMTAIKQAESEARADAYESAEGFMLQGGSVEEFQAQDPDAWERLSPKQQKTLQSGAPVATNWNTFSDLMTLPKAELAKVDPTDYYDQLAPAQRTQLISAVKTANNTATASEKVDNQVGRSRTAQVKSTVEQLFGKLSKISDSKRPQVDAFYALVDSEVEYRETEKGSKLTSEEFTALLGDMTRKVVIERSFWFDAERDISDIPAEDIPALSKFLRDNGVPVTSDNLIKAYEQAK